MRMPDPKLWTTRELCQKLMLPSPLADEAIGEFLRRYRGILVNVSASLPRRSWNEDYETFEQWALAWFYARRKFGYLADLASKLDDSLPDSVVAEKVGAYFRTTVIKTARNDYKKEEGLDGRTPTGLFNDEIDYLNPRSRPSNPFEEEDDDSSSIDSNDYDDDPITENPAGSQEPDDLNSDTDNEEHDSSDKAGPRRTVPVENIMGRSTLDFSRGPGSDSLEGEELFQRLMEFLRQLPPRDRVIFSLKEYALFEEKGLNDEDWNYLEELTGSTRPAIEKAIEEEYRARPGATKRPIRTEFIASLLKESEANVDKVFSRLRVKSAEVLGSGPEER